MVEEGDLEAVLDQPSASLPALWRTTRSGRPMPDVASAVRRSRRER